MAGDMRYRWGAFKRWLKRNSKDIRKRIRDPKVGGPIAGVAFLLAIVITLVFLGDDDEGLPTSPTQLYFFDMESKKLFAGPRGVLPPITAESGPHKGARAYVYACGDCDKDQFIGYVEVYLPDHQKAVQSGDRFAAQNTQSGHLISKHEELKWVPRTSQQGHAIIRETWGKCPAGKPKPCFP